MSDRNVRPTRALPDAVGLLVCVIARSHQWTGLYVAEAETKSFFFQIAKFFECVEAGNRQVVARRSQVLSYSQDIHTAFGQIPEHVHEFGHCLAQADHKTGFRHHSWGELL